MPITLKQITAAYGIAKRVHNGELTEAQGATDLVNDQNLNANSAKDFIRCYGHMQAGTRFQRGLSILAIDNFLTWFKLTGVDAHIKAIEALQLHIDYYERELNINRPGLRHLVSCHQENGLHRHLTAVQEVFSKAVKYSLQDSNENRRVRLTNAPKKPPSTIVVSRIFNRNPDVVAEVLLRANGVCERCKNKAPFKRQSNGSPYLEVHHKEQLAQGGEDTIDNAIALCPNCHRFLHHGKNEIKGELREGWAADSARIAANENDDEALGFT